jgi:hypothetical protein
VCGDSLSHARVHDMNTSVMIIRARYDNRTSVFAREVLSGREMVFFCDTANAQSMMIVVEVAPGGAGGVVVR